MSIKETIIRPS